MNDERNDQSIIIIITIIISTLQVIAGCFVNGPYALITTAVSAELGTKVKSSQALATVTGKSIINIWISK